LDVTGTVTADGLTIQGAVAFDGTIDGVINYPYSAFFNLDTINASGGSVFQIGRDATGTSANKVFTARENGDISFYEDTGTTAKFFWDASAESLGVGTSSPSAPIDVVTATAGKGLRLANTTSGTDHARLVFAASNGTSYSAAGSTLGAVDFASRASNGADGVMASIFAENPTGSTYWSPPTDLVFTTSTANNNPAERMRIDSSGNVGIGTSSPSLPLDVHGGTIGVTSASSYAGLQINSVNTSFGYINFGDPEDGNIGQINYDHADNSLSFKTNNFERARIDSSGNLLVGTTSTGVTTSSTTEGVEIRPDFIGVARTSNPTAYFNRVSTDGDITVFRKDGTTVGSIGSVVGAYLRIGTSDTGIMFQNGTSSIEPRTESANNDAAINLGAATNRFKDLYLSGGVVFGTTGGAVTSKTLDDYEEGTFTPSLVNISGGAITYTAQEGYYTKVGRMVNVHYKIVVATNTHTTGNCAVSVPFASFSGGGISLGSVGINTTGVALVTHSFYAAVAHTEPQTSTGGYLLASQVGAGETLYGHLTYYVA